MRFLNLMLLMLLSQTAFAQTVDPFLQRPVFPICVLPVAPFEGALYIPPPTVNGLSEFEKSAAFSFNYLPNGANYNGRTCITWPLQAQAALEFAANIWGSLLNSNQTITVNACWTTSLGANTLGSAGPTSFAQLTPPTAWYALPLAESILGFNLGNPFPDSEIDAYFNSTRSDWYFGTDGAPAFNQVDFVTTALHELGHGLGFIGVAGFDNGGGAPECDGISGHGCLGFESSGAYIPTSFSLFIETDNSVDALNTDNPSTDLGTLLTGGSLSGGPGGLYAAGMNLLEANGNTHAKLYTPMTFSPGSSYAHFDLSTYPGQLMKPLLSLGQAIHNPGLALQMLEDQGWPLAGPLPVELISFTAEKSHEGVFLHWETATELDNRGFEVQRLADGDEWETQGWVAGKGTCLEKTTYSLTDENPLSGINYYRLVQHDYDGSLFKTDVVALFWAEKQRNPSLWPNPAQDQVTLHWPDVDATVTTNIQVFDRFGNLIQEAKMNGSMHKLSLADLPDGVYIILLRNEREVRQLSVVKQRT